LAKLTATPLRAGFISSGSLGLLLRASAWEYDYDAVLLAPQVNAVRRGCANVQPSTCMLCACGHFSQFRRLRSPRVEVAFAHVSNYAQKRLALCAKQKSPARVAGPAASPRDG
jgi:hypothetical protein